MKTTTTILFLLIVLFQFQSAAAQRVCDCPSGLEGKWCWGDDVKTAKEKNVLYSDAFKSKDYKGSLEPLEWLLQNTPCLNKSIYIRSLKIYKKLAKAETDPAQKIKYQDRELELYNIRIQNFGEEAKIMQKKGNVAYTYLYKRPNVDKTALYDLYKKIFELNKEKTNRSNLKIYMLMAVNAKRQKNLDVDGVLDVYDKLSEVIEANIEKAEKGSKDHAKWVKSKDAIDGLLAKAVKIDCAFVREKMGAKLKSNPDDLKLAKRALKFMIQDKCTDDPLFLVAAENIYAKEPTAGLAIILAKKYLSDKKYAVALAWYEKGITLSEEDPQKKAELYLDMSKVYNVQGKKSLARTNAKKSLEFDPTAKSEVYTMIGNMYMGSGKSCGGNDPVSARFCYLAAYDAYKMAGNTSKMARAREQFPSATDIFNDSSYEIGNAVSVGCWIGGKTILRKRPKATGGR